MKVGINQIVDDHRTFKDFKQSLNAGDVVSLIFDVDGYSFVFEVNWSKFNITPIVRAFSVKQVCVDTEKGVDNV